MRFPSTNHLMTWAMAACLAAFAAPSLFADEVLRHIQQSLRDQGFYYGSIDGTPGDETTQAIKRYQIRNGLPVTGQLDDQTRKSIEHAEAAVAKGSSSTSKGSANSHTSTSSSAADDRQYAEATPPPLAGPAHVPPPAPDQEPVLRSAPHAAPETDSGDENDSPAAAAPARPDLRVQPGGVVQQQGPMPPGAVPIGAVPPSPALTGMFERTPYEFAPPPVQADILRRAQAALLRDGFYDGDADGVPGPRTSEALSNLQEVSHIRATGRLDVQTLAILRLLPRSQPVPRRYYYGPGAMPGPGGVYEGRIVQ
jgi:peptidoglycan hydrolase-like protein with peptidoglycan-binding domain